MEKVLYQADVEVCDFCNAPDPAWAYPCEDFIIDGIGSKGAWAACQGCRVLIDRVLTDVQNKDILVHRAMKGFGFSADLDIAHARRMQEAFFVHRCGPPMASADCPEPAAQIVWDDGES